MSAVLAGSDPVTRSTDTSPTTSGGRSPQEAQRWRRVKVTLLVLAGLCVAACAAYLVWNVRGNWSYALSLRSRQLGALVVVGVAVGVSSLVFQTVSGSRILTPGVMGFDALYSFIQTVIVFTLGAGTLQLLGVVEQFLLTALLLSAFGLLLFRWLFRAHSRNLFVLVLVGIVLGGLFSSLSSFASRLLSPDDYLTLQAVLFASFTTVDVDLLLACAVVTALGCAVLWPLLRQLDVIDLGRERAVALGVDHHRIVTRVLLVVTVLVATSTALVGPMVFLGLLIANLARQLVPTHEHRWLVLASGLVGILALVLGQFVVLHGLGLAVPLSVVINLVGGLYFLILLVKAVRL
ncbi:putative iron-siderophore ABC transporter (permease) [Nostocoides australiense Ben110]|uniref:Putative iron-siderophore ABC transporter (Permease) n=1 Tax=Nostocoides australiense Ben110 TaxID=1193182 RepID=W6K059_9MICO|nr:iron chelate uptake ABC transporter family permease subunit [Tetrasphaera australiensis]CCH74385.1 putative iron-siderophore ABC transporter (permease) [Tetrasphaera australiensis Ben110]